MSLPSYRPDAIAILDFGGQYCHLIARRVREMNVYSEIHPSDLGSEDVELLNRRMDVKGIILSGSPGSVRRGTIPFKPEILDLDFPVLGLCYGHQLIADFYGGEVSGGESREYGSTEAIVEHPIGVLRGMEPQEQVWMSHGDTVLSLPANFEVLAHTENCPVAAFRHKDKHIWGLQWHPEVAHTEKGMMMLRNFVFNICGCESNWEPADILDESVREIEEEVGDGRAIIALSGGVDSSVAAALAGEGLRDKLIAVHVDNGLMRSGESRAVEEALSGLGLEVKVIDATERFLSRLEGVVDPEIKRRIIGEEFIRVFEEEAKLQGAEYLIQGTIYPDRIESGISRDSDTIKTHHNVGGLPSDIKFNAIIEPLRDLYKDEVRLIGRRLGLPERFVDRQPFPGPGLAVRVAGEVTHEKLSVLRQADSIVCEEVENSSAVESLWQYFAVLTDTKSTGVKGDERAYCWTVALRLVQSVDGMTANFFKPPWKLLEDISNRIVNEVPGVTRVVYDITNKPPSTIEWE
ncbi:MAG: glutamine-hydrolyzing GMP synthase [Candidatus Bathyarchaeia archaeon]